MRIIKSTFKESIILDINVNYLRIPFTETNKIHYNTDFDYHNETENMLE
jgi:hypothetical protein